MAENQTPAVHRALQPLARAPRLSDRVADRMLAEILAQGLKSGSRLPSERELGEQFGVSRTVIREATRALVAKGILDVRAGAGLSVAAVDPAAVAESMSWYLRGGGIPYEKVHEVRTMIEIQVAGLAAERGTAEQIDQLRQIHEAVTALTEQGDYGALAVADVEYHRQLARMTANELHLLMLDAIGDVLLEIRLETVNNPADSLVAVGAHGRILDRVIARDLPGARTAMAAHLEQAFQEWERMGRPVGKVAAAAESS
ncbi:MAG: FadR family transcriptional regulator [Chloroflexota bacterium]|nr:FadR family transcriptional regulator [Chloroflexota bacterium]